MPEPRESVRRMAPYHPPSEGREGKLRLDFNENTVGCSPKVLECLRGFLTADALTIYPAYRDAIARLGRFFDVAEDEFTITNGTDEAIQLFVNSFVEQGDDVLMLKPSYAMYRFYSEVAGASIREVEYRENLSFDLDTFLGAIRPATRAIFIANPNNPTGVAIAAADLRAILQAAPDAAVLIDEAYYDFYGHTLLGAIREFSNLFVCRTFSKVYGMAALRCGCLFSNAANMQWMRKAQSPYSVNALATVAACAAAEDREFRENHLREVLAARELVYEGFRRLGIRYYASETNFVLFAVGDRAIPIRDALRERGVLVRDRSYELPGCLRVTIGTRAQTERFLRELEDVWTR